MTADKDQIKQERQLIARCAKGDKGAWYEFVDTYERLIYSAILHTFQFMGYANKEEAAEDIFQEVLTLLVKNNYAKLLSLKWKNGCSLASWLVMIAKGKTFDYARRTFSRQKIILPFTKHSDDGKDAFDNAASLQHSALEGLEHKERVSIFKEALEKLPKNDLCLLNLIYFREFSHARAAKIMGKSLRAVYMQKKRAIEKLKDIVKKYRSAQ